MVAGGGGASWRFRSGGAPMAVGVVCGGGGCGGAGGGGGGAELAARLRGGGCGGGGRAGNLRPAGWLCPRGPKARLAAPPTSGWWRTYMQLYSQTAGCIAGALTGPQTCRPFTGRRLRSTRSLRLLGAKLLCHGLPLSAASGAGAPAQTPGLRELACRDMGCKGCACPLVKTLPEAARML